MGMGVKLNLFIVGVMDVSVKQSPYCRYNVLPVYCIEMLLFKWEVFFP